MQVEAPSLSSSCSALEFHTSACQGIVPTTLQFKEKATSKPVSTYPRIVAVIPAYNEAGHVGVVVTQTRKLVDEVIVVDDGSTDGTGEEALAAGARVYRHLVNRGVGGATVTGLKAAIRCGGEIIVTLDADGQHLTSEIPSLVEPVRRDSADLTVGCRLIHPAGMPPIRRVANHIGDFCTRVLFGVRVRDTQSGFRALRREVAERLELRTSRMEICSEILGEATRQGFRIQEVAVSAIYTTYSLSKGQGFRTGLKTLAKLMLRSMR